MRIAIEIFDGHDRRPPAFRLPFASRMLMEMLGFEGVDWRDLAGWSQAMMDGVGNYAGNPEIFRRAREATEGTKAAFVTGQTIVVDGGALIPENAAALT